MSRASTASAGPGPSSGVGAGLVKHINSRRASLAGGCGKGSPSDAHPKAEDQHAVQGQVDHVGGHGGKQRRPTLWRGSCQERLRAGGLLPPGPATPRLQEQGQDAQQEGPSDSHSVSVAAKGAYADEYAQDGGRGEAAAAQVGDGVPNNLALGCRQAASAEHQLSALSADQVCDRRDRWHMMVSHSTFVGFLQRPGIGCSPRMIATSVGAKFQMNNVSTIPSTAAICSPCAETCEACGSVTHR